MRKVIFWAALLFCGCCVWPAHVFAQLASPFSNSVWPAQTFTATGQTGNVIQLNGLTTPSSTVGSSFASGSITLTGTSLTTVTFAVQGSSDNGVTYYALPIYALASPGSSPATTVTATVNGIYQVSLAGLTHIKLVTSGTFTATSVSLVFTASPNVSISKNNGGGTLSVGIGGGPSVGPQLTNAQAVGANKFSINGLNMLGDSHTVGTGTANIPAYSYGALLAAQFGQPVKNFAVSGSWAADVTNLQVYPNFNPTRNNNIPTTLMIGTNDAAACTAGAGSLIPGCENNYSHTLMSAAAWLTIPLEFKIIPQTGIANGNCTTTGTWTNTTYGKVSALSSIVPGSTLTCTSLTAVDTAVYANWFAQDGLTATATFAIDGITVDTWNAFGFNSQAIATQNGTTQTAFASRYPLATAGTHTYRVTVGTAGSSNAFTVLWMGSPTPQTPTPFGGITQNPPRLALAGVLKQKSDAQSANTLFYNNLALAVAAQLSADGALVYPVNVRAYVGLDTPGLDSDYEAATLANGFSTVNSTVPGAHLNGSLSNGVVVGGHRHLADAFLAAMAPPVPATPFTFTVPGASPLYQYFKDWDDGTVLATGSIGSPSAQSCTIVSTGSAQDVNHPGVLVVASGTVTSAGEACSPASGFHAPISNLNTGSAWSLENLVFTPTLPGTSGLAFQVGLATTLTVNPWTTGVGFYLSASNGVQNDWYCEYGSTVVDTGIAASTTAWTKLDIIATGSVVSWLINGQATASGCTGVAQSSMPSTVQNIAWTSLSFTSGTSFPLNIDYTLFQRAVSR